MNENLTGFSLSLRRPEHLMHMAHLSGNTSGFSKSSSDWLNYTGFPGDAAHFLMFRLETKMMPNTLTKEESHRVYNCDNERVSVSTKLWIFWKYVKYTNFAAYNL